MAKAHVWEKFIEERNDILTPQENGVLMIILYEPLEPQPIYGLLSTGRKVNYEALGYAVDEDGKPIRESRFYLSKNMLKIKNWCEKHGLRYRWGPGRGNEPAQINNFIEIHGNITQECLDEFPMEYDAMQVHPRKAVI
jgi:hypothetical protein